MHDVPPVMLAWWQFHTVIDKHTAPQTTLLQRGRRWPMPSDPTVLATPGLLAQGQEACTQWQPDDD